MTRLRRGWVSRRGNIRDGAIATKGGRDGADRPGAVRDREIPGHDTVRHGQRATSRDAEVAELLMKGPREGSEQVLPVFFVVGPPDVLARRRHVKDEQV